MQKLSKALVMSTRKRIKEKNFALPGRGSGESGKGPGSYPIHDRCLHGDTKIALLKGGETPIRDLVGQEVWIYAYNLTTRSIVPALATNVRKTKDDLVLSVKLDNGEEVLCTSTHPFLLRNGRYRQAGNLAPGDALMPLYLKKKSRKKSTERTTHYEHVYQPWYRIWELVHRMVWREAHVEHIPDGCVVHHVNENIFDNTPDNLNLMSRGDHCAFHGRAQMEKLGSEAYKATKSAAMCKRWSDPARRRKQSKMMKKENARRKDDPVYWEQMRTSISEKNGGANHWTRCRPKEEVHEKMSTAAHRFWDADLRADEVRERLRDHARNQNQKRTPKDGTYANHKVVSVTSTDQKVPVYDMTVEGFENFGLACGIFVHNSHGALALTFAKRNLNRGKLSQEDYQAIVGRVRSKYPTMGKEASMKKIAEDKPKLTPKETKQLLDADLMRRSRWVTNRTGADVTIEETAAEEAACMITDAKTDANIIRLARSMGGIDKLQEYCRSRLISLAKTKGNKKDACIMNSGEHPPTIHKVAMQLDAVGGMLPYTFKAAFLDELEKTGS